MFFFLRNRLFNDYGDYTLNGSNYCFFHDVNIDADGDGVADTNLDTNGDGCPDINIDAGNGLIINWDTDGDGFADTNLDTNYDLVPDENLESEKSGENKEVYLKPEDDTTDHMNMYPEGFETVVNDMFADLDSLDIMIDPSHLPLDNNQELEKISDKIKENLSGYGIDKIADSLSDVGLNCDIQYNCSGSDNGGKWKYEMDLKDLIFSADYYGNTSNLLFSQKIDFNTGKGIAVNYSEYFYAVSNSLKMTYDVYHGTEEGVYATDDTDDLLWQNHETIMNKLFFVTN